MPDGAVDFIVCAQSFHWFDRTAAQAEFRRILKPGGKAVLIWNSRVTTGNPFLADFDRLLHKFGADYEKVGHKNITQQTLSAFFSHGGPQLVRFKNGQKLSFESLKGRLLSSSYSPLPGQPAYEPMISELRELFDRNQLNGQVSLDYETELYWGEV
nr:methyltransferase domain-containing protein [Cohnella faecalis]